MDSLLRDSSTEEDPRPSGIPNDVQVRLDVDDGDTREVNGGTLEEEVKRFGDLDRGIN